MKKEIKLTLLIRFYKPTNDQVKYWKSIIGDLSKMVNVHILVDEPNLEINWWGEVFTSKVNLGRFRVVYDHVQSGNVKTSHFKVIDADDYISLEKLRFLRQNFKYNKIYVQETNKYRGKRLKNQISVENQIKSLEPRSKIIKSYATYKTIFPTFLIKNEKIFCEKKRINFGEDTVLAMIAISNGAKVVKRINNFSLYHMEIGCTKLENLEEEIIENLNTYIQIESLQKIKNNFKFRKFVNKTIFYMHQKRRQFNRKFGVDINKSSIEKLNKLENLERNIK